jgi:hypothetical protein
MGMIIKDPAGTPFTRKLLKIPASLFDTMVPGRLNRVEDMTAKRIMPGTMISVNNGLIRVINSPTAKKNARGNR